MTDTPLRQPDRLPIPASDRFPPSDTRIATFLAVDITGFFKPSRNARNAVANLPAVCP
jgi:hypothetical protein